MSLVSVPLLVALAFSTRAQEPPALVPAPRSLVQGEGELALPSPLPIVAAPGLEDHAGAVAELWWRLGAGPAELLGQARPGALALALDDALEEERYRLEVGDDVRITGGSPAAVAHGTASFLQLVARGPDGWSAPRVAIDDAPAAPFRAVMVDIARQPHTLPTLRGVVDLAHLYKVRYLHLHLTDDQSFAFPFEPVTGEAGTILSLEEWRAFAAYADARGVTVIPELDLPGHSRVLKRSGYLVDPTPDDGLSDADVAHPDNHARIFRIVDAMLDVFRSSPYFHIGGDESGAGGALVPFLAATNRHLRGRAEPRRLLVWEGFHGAPDELPATGDDHVIVMAWESAYNPPWSLLDAGYRVVNASWKPLYAVGGGTPRHPHIGGRRWSARDIHAWSKDHFWHWQAGTPVFEDRGPGDDHPNDGIWPVPAAQRGQVLGGELLFWEQREHTVLADAWERVAALADRLWCGERPEGADYVGFRRRGDAVGERVRRLVQPARIRLGGAFDAASPVRDDFHWFHGQAEVSIDVDPALPGEVRLTRDGSPPQADSELYTGPFRVAEAAALSAWLFVDGVGVGAPASARIDNRPARVRAAWFDLPRRALPYVPDFSDRRRWTPFLEGLLPELRGPYRTTEPVGQQLTGTLLVPEDRAGEHVFRLQTRDGRALLYVDGVRLLGPSAPSEEKLFATLDLAPGAHTVRVDHASGPISPVVLVAVQRPGDDKPVEVSRLLAEIPRGTEPLTLGPLAAGIDLLAGGTLDAFRLAAHRGNPPLADVAKLGEDGVLRIAGSPGGYLVTRRWFRDYRLDLEWRWPAGGRPGNSGVLLHVTTPLLFYGWPRSLEVQLQHGRAGDFWTIGRDVDLTIEDDAERRTRERPSDLHSHRRLARRVDGVERPVGEWNRMTVVCRGGDVTVTINGIETQRGIDGTLTEGGIALQSEGAPIELRNLWLSPLPLVAR
ncbi:MAG: family 16 glycoside hydrolase [Planctomycetota bacterium]